MPTRPARRPALPRLPRPLVERGRRRLDCARCAGTFAVEDGIPRLLDDRLPGIAREAGRDRGLGRARARQGWYEPDDEVDAVLPFLNRDLGWEDKNWRANEHSFSLLLDALRAPGDARARGRRRQVLGRAAPRSRAAASTSATDILDDPEIGLGRGAFYARAGRRVRARAGRRRAPAVRRRDLRPRLLRRDAAPRARPAADAARDGARDAAGRRRRGAERGHARARAERRRTTSRPRRTSSGSTSTCTRSGRTCGRSRAPGSSMRPASSRPRATAELATPQHRRRSCCACRVGRRLVDALRRRTAYGYCGRLALRAASGAQRRVSASTPTSSATASSSGTSSGATCSAKYKGSALGRRVVARRTRCS